MGRKKKYDGVLVNRSIALPLPINEYINDIIEEKNISFNSYIIAMINNSDNELSSQTAQKFEDLNVLLNGAINDNKELTSQLMSMKNLKISLFETIEKDDFISKFMKSKKDSIEKMKDNVVNTNGIVDIIYMDFEKLLLMKNVVIKKPSTTKLLIKQEILKM